MKLIINADDFGITESCTKAIAEAFNKNLITDTTMVANCDAFNFALKLSENNEIRNNIGVHFNLTEGVPLTEKIKKYPDFVENGSFHGHINRLKPLTESEKQAVYEELTAQVDRIISAGIIPTHADSHHHIHTGIFIASTVLKVCKEHNITKIRLHRNIGKISAYKMFVKKKYNKWLISQGFKTTDFFGTLEDTQQTLSNGLAEIMVHPDFDKDGLLVDRIDINGQYAVGQPLNRLSKLNQKNRKSYKDI